MAREHVCLAAGAADGAFARLTLESGFTTIRDVGTNNRLIFALRQAAAEGAMVDRSVQRSGDHLTGGHGSEYGVLMYIEADTAEEIRRGVTLR